MCFGNSQTSTVNTNSSYTPASYLSGAAQQNLTSAENLQNAGFSPYTGQQVANFSPQQTSSFGMGNQVATAAGGNIMPGASALNLGLNTAANAPTVSAPTISSMMSPYMNQYVQMALNPQIANANNQFALNQQLTQGQATSAGAFGDPRANLLQQNQQLNNNLSMQGLVGNAYNAAFNTAIGAGAQDVANNINAQTANAGIWNNQVANLYSGSNAAFGQGTQATNLQNTLGSQQTAQQQAQLNALYNQWLMAQQYPFLTSQNMSQAISSATPASPSTSSSTQVGSQPNNSGYGILGSLLGASMNGGSGGFSNSALGGMLSSVGSGLSSLGATAAGMGPFLIGLEKGGPAHKGRPYVVGEKGPELFVPHGDDGLLHRAFGGPVPNGMPTMVGERGPEMWVPNGGAGGGMPGGGGGFNPQQFMQMMQSNPQFAQRMQQMRQQMPQGGVPPIQGGGPMQMAGNGITPGTMVPPPDPGVNVPMRAKGGPVKSGQPTIVGENGPEIITPQQSGTVIPYEKLRDALKKKKGVATGGLAAQLAA